MTQSLAEDRQLRAKVAVAFGALTAAYATARGLHEPLWATDFDQLWHAAKSLLAGNDPYSAVGPGKAFPWSWPLYYPLPAVIIAVPFTALPVLGARIAFSGVAAAVLGWAIGPRIRTHWPIVLSAAYIISASRTQWAPLLLAAAWIPLLGFVITAKPNVGLSTLATQDRQGAITALAGCAAMLLVSFAVEPGWLSSWRDVIRTAPHIQSAITALPAGPLLALAALKWRRPDARLLLALAIIPHTPSVYDLLVLFFACRNLRETLVLALLTQALYWGIVFFGSFNTFEAYAAGLGRAAVFIVYLPVLAAILLRPNQVIDTAAMRDTTQRMTVIPRNWIDASLLALLLIAATMLVWLPLVTYR
jgi:hypothetical protein